MQQSKQKSGFGWGYFFVGLLFIVGAVFAFAYPGASLEAVAYLFAVLAIVNGLWLIFSNISRVMRVVAGVLNILLGIFMFANIYLAVAALPLVFSIWFIVNSVFALVNAPISRALGEGYFWFTIIINILGVLVGILLLFQPMVAALTLSFLVGFYLALIGVECIVLAFARAQVASMLSDDTPLDGDTTLYHHN